MDWGYVNCIDQDELDPSDNWQRLFNPVDFDTRSLVPLSELVTIENGITTGEVGFFCLSEAEVEEWEIEEQYLSRLIRKPEYVEGYDVREEDWERQRAEGVAVWLLYHLNDLGGIPQSISEEIVNNTCLPDFTPDGVHDGNNELNVIEYLRYGLTEHETLATRSTLYDRTQWYRVERQDPAPILVSYGSRSRTRFILNETDARFVSGFHGLHLDVHLKKTETKALLAYLNSRAGDEVVRDQQHTISSGWDKIEPGDLGNVQVLDPRELSEETVAELAAAFDDLRQVARDSGDPETVINKIDEIIYRELSSGNSE